MVHEPGDCAHLRGPNYPLVFTLAYKGCRIPGRNSTDGTKHAGLRPEGRWSSSFRISRYCCLGVSYCVPPNAATEVWGGSGVDRGPHRKERHKKHKVSDDLDCLEVYN